MCYANDGEENISGKSSLVNFFEAIFLEFCRLYISSLSIMDYIKKSKVF